MAEDGKIVYKIQVDSDDAVKEAEKAGKKIGEEVEKPVEKNSKKIEEIMKGMARRVGEVIVDMAVKAGKAIKDFALDSIGLASDLSEVQNVVDTTFGAGAEKIYAWAKSAGEAYGLSELAALQYTSTLGAMFKSMGLGQSEIETMSTSLTGLAGDMASFYNLDPEIAFEKLRAGIAGEIEPLRQLGINMSVANLEAYALSQGITTAYAEMSQAEQATLRYNYILQTTADAQGDFAKTSDSFANQQRILQMEIETLSAQFGEALLPAALSVVGALRELVQWAGEHGTALTIMGVAVATITAAIIAYNVSLSMAATGMTLATAAGAAFSAVLAFITSPITLVIAAIGALVAATVLIVRNWEQISTFFVNLWNSIVSLFNSAVAAISNTLASWWEAIKHFFANGIAAIISFFNIDWWSIGANIVRGIWQGIQGLWSGLVADVQAAVSRLWQSAKNALGIASPSKKFKYIGEMSVEGVEAGFDENLPTLNRKVYSSFENLGETAEQGISSAPDIGAVSQSFNVNLAASGTGGAREIIVPLYINDREFARATAWDMGEQLAWREV